MFFSSPYPVLGHGPGPSPGPGPNLVPVLGPGSGPGKNLWSRHTVYINPRIVGSQEKTQSVHISPLTLM